MGFRTCDVDALAAHVRLQGPRTIGVAGVEHARTALLADELASQLPATVITGGALLLDGGPDDRFDVRVWMEESVHHLVEAAQQQARGEGRRGHGRWSANAPPASSPAHAAMQEVERQQARADATFVVLGGWPQQVRLRFFADFSDFALWDDEGHAGDIEELLPITDDLRRRIRRWALADDRARTRGDGERQREEARRLVAELRERLGPGYRIDDPR